jgi:hypothetical protein
VANADSIREDAVRIKLAGDIATVVTTMAGVKLKAAGMGFGSVSDLDNLAAKVVTQALPAIVKSVWGGIDDFTKVEIAKMATEVQAGRHDVYIDFPFVLGQLAEQLNMQVLKSAGRVAVTINGHQLKIVNLAEVPGVGPAPIQIDVHVPPAQLTIQNAVNVPQQPAPAVHVYPTVSPPFQPTKTEIEYEIGPDGRQRPKAITRK